jgi:hypothetical protein
VLGPVLLSLAIASSTSITTFQTPSHGIACAYASASGEAAVSLRCDVADVVSPPKRPKSCELDYGSAFGLSATGRAKRLCAGDTVLNPKAKVLAYNKTRHLGPFTCTSRVTGLRCATKAHHGFVLSRRMQKLF